MNNLKFRQIYIFGRRFLVAFIGLLMAVGLLITQLSGTALGMMRSDPDDIEPIGGVGGEPPAYQPPYEGFTWSIEKRFGPDKNLDGMIDYHWDATQMKYAKDYVYPSGWTVTFNGCRNQNDHDHPEALQYTYTWLLDSASMTTNNKCFLTKYLTDQSSHTVKLTVVDANGDPVAIHDGLNYVEYPVQIRDYFIVSIGDSYASGQGNPDIPMIVTQGPFGIGWIMDEPAYWQDFRCSRSADAAPALAALELEASDPHSTVTFISFACSGASLNTPRYDNNDQNKNVGSGILGPYRGDNTDVPYSDTGVGYIPSQMDQLRDALIPPAGMERRQIDSLIVSGGGNDIQFLAVAEACMWNLDCWNNPLVSVKEHPNDANGWSLYSLVERALGLWGANGPSINVPASYDTLGAQIFALDPKPANVYITQYPDQTYGNNGDHDRMLDDIAFPNPYFQITIPEAAVASHSALGRLNDAVLAAVNRFKIAYPAINWQFVDGLSVYNVDDQVPSGTRGLFLGPEGGPGHGYNASDNWIRRADESEIIQGPVNFRNQTKGTLHPNFSGHQVIKFRILRYMMPDLVGEPPQAAPVISFSYTSAGLTSQAGLNGWYIRSCDGAGVCYPKVVAQAVATSDVAMTGAGILVDDVMGCSGSVHCEITPSTDGKQVTYSVEISASGTYRFQFNAQNPGGQVASLQHEIKVDLEDPVLATPFGPFTVDEGGLVEISASMATDADGIPLNDDGLVDFDWDLDNDGDFETTDEQIVFSAAELDGVTSQTIQVQVMDRAGRTASAQTSVNVLNVAPTVAIDGAPATSPEGTSINLLADVTDPFYDDSFTYAWLVTKDGANYTTGSQLSFSFTPTDEGTYEVSLSVTDDDGGTGTATNQLIDVTNVAPDFSTISVPSNGANEATSFTFSGEITEPGTEDALTLTIDWGDGSLADVVSLPAGTDSFSLGHTYADDNPTATSSDTYQINLSIEDDDGGSDSASVNLVVNNLLPTVTITAPENGALYANNAQVSLTASLADASLLDTLTCSIDWADGATGSGTLTNGICVASHAYTAPGVYLLGVTAADDDLGTKTESMMVVVYDPSAGFVTGGGWINSLAGAYKVDLTLSGKATFGFVSKYTKGQSVPTGNTAFNFDVAGLSFASQSYEWLVVNQAGTNAQFKGSGLINGMLDPNGQSYKFMVWAGDGSPDTFRIRIWYEDATGQHDVYDNGVDQAIGGGNIVVHTTR